MLIEYMLYFYGAVCVSMIIFNLVYSLILRRSEPRMKKRQRRLEAAMDLQLERLRQGLPVEARHCIYLQRRLRRVQNLGAFDMALRSRLRDKDEPLMKAYLAALQPSILYLTMVYRKRETTQAAYFSYFLSQYMLREHMHIQTLQDLLLSYMKKNSLYCRVNALQALCAFGSPEYLVSALHIQDGSSVFIHEKILTEALLSYTGEHSRLISLLLEKLDSFSVHTQLAILNYIRFCSGGYCREMFAIMEDESRDKELRLSAIRYFGRYSYPPALERLLSFASDRDPAHWEYATVAVSSLARYRGEEVVDALKQALHSSNWYVRSAAAAGLQAQGLDYSRFMDIMGGSDRYAREMLSYQLESHSFQKAGV